MPGPTPNPSSLRRAAAVTTVPSAAAMSSRPPFRGDQRNYSHRPTIPTAGNYNYNYNGYNNNNNIVNNSYHFQSYNYNNLNNNCYNFQSYNYNSTSHNNQINFRSGNDNIRNCSGSGRGGVRGSFGSRGVAPPYNRPEGRLQRPKPADFRTWEFAKLVPPPNSERFVVLSYNILADYLANGHRNLYFHIPRRFMSWDWRKNNILFELKLWSPDIICFQEVDKFQELEEDLRVRGYIGFWKMRTGKPDDGCAIFFRSTRLMFEDSIEFNRHGMRDNVAQICVLESLATNQFGNQVSSSSSGGPNRVVVCNIHVLYNPRRGEMKLGQVRMLLEKAQAVSKTWDNAPIVLCGDFNCTPKSPLYNFISQQKLDIAHVDRDKVSGQASAEIRAPARLYSHQASGQPAGNMVNPAMTSNIILEKDTKVNDSLNKSQADNSHSPSPKPVEMSVVGPPSDLPSQPVADQNASSAFNSDETDEKFSGLSANKIDESLEDNEDLCKDTETFLSVSQSGVDLSPSNLSEVVLEANTKDKPIYNPSQWTPNEIATATGNTDCIKLEHPLKLQSTYSEVVGSSGTRDSCGEPVATSYNSSFMGTVDYIWRSEGLQTTKVLAPLPKDVMQPSGGFPTKKWGSDHIALATELAFTR